MIKTGIVGASGYTGLELMHACLSHPKVSLTSLYSTSLSGQSASAVYPHLNGVTELEFQAFEPLADFSHLDLLFLAIPHGLSHEWLGTIHKAHPALKIIDLSADFRLNDPAEFKAYYGKEHADPTLLNEVPLGIPELHREKIKNASIVANPGCYAISSILALYPLAKEGLIEQSPIIDAKSGVSGAGKQLKANYLFSEANEAISAYALTGHRHSPEIQQECMLSDLVFTPQLIPQNRGILATIYLSNTKGLSQAELNELYSHYYEQEPFVQLHPDLETPSTRLAVGSNNCVITAQALNEKQLRVFSATDNLLKGAAGQAIQNMNIIFGLDERLGLPVSARII